MSESRIAVSLSSTSFLLKSGQSNSGGLVGSLLLISAQFDIGVLIVFDVAFCVSLANYMFR